MTVPATVGWKRYVDLALAGARAMLDLSMMVVGIALVGLAAAVVLAGFGLVDRRLDLSTGAMLGSALVLAVVGAFGLGVASEGSMRAAYRLLFFDPVEALIARAAGAVVMAGLLLVAVGKIEPYVGDLTAPILEGLEVVRASAKAGFVAAIIGAPLAWAIDWRGWSRRWPGLETLPIFLVWAIATMAMFTPPV